MSSLMIFDDLYQNIIDNPDADAPRLAYAAACDAAGNRDRAEFIRIQMETTNRMRSGANNSSEFVHREIDLLNAHGEEWAGPIRAHVARCEFFRGFVEWIKIDATRFLTNAGEFYHLAPLRRLALTNVAPVIEELFESPHLSRVVSLTIEVQKLGDRELEVLAHSPHLEKLACLYLAGNNITMAGVEALAASSGLPALQYVDFTFNPAHEHVQESYGTDHYGHVIFGAIGGLLPLEHRYGRKAWLHTVEDRRREVFEAEF